jgi:hypothetical protein
MVIVAGLYLIVIWPVFFSPATAAVQLTMANRFGDPRRRYSCGRPRTFECADPSGWIAVDGRVVARADEVIE